MRLRPNKPKSVHDVRGWKERCPNFQSCPLCYGCRRYNSTDPDCLICLQENKKFNICNTDLHKDDVTAKMITKNNILLTNIKFKSFSA